jgi:uncharacterized protein (TIGR02391 family)
MNTAVKGASKSYVQELLATQIQRGKDIDLRIIPLAYSLEQAIHDEEKWDKYVRDALDRHFTNAKFSNEYGTGTVNSLAGDLNSKSAQLKSRVRKKVAQLESIFERLEFCPEVGASGKVDNEHPPELVGIHPAIKEKCEKLYREKNYAEAVEKGFKVSRDRLRELTGFETGSDAFGRARLHIRGAAAENVDSDFNEGVKFLCMAIDKFRNEKSHTSNADIHDAVKAQHYLVLSSLAMTLLDNAELP